MRDVELNRRTHRRQAQRAAGIYPGDPLFTAGDAAAAGYAAEIFALPERATDAPAIQGAGGGFAWMLDFDPLDSGGPLL